MDLDLTGTSISSVDGFEELTRLAKEAQAKDQIPRIIHKIWWQSLSALPEKYHAPLLTWSTFNEDWRIFVWDEVSILQLFDAYFVEHKEFFEAYPRMIQKIDAAKYFILSKFGGCYSDMDQSCLKPLSSAIDIEKETSSILVSPLTDKKSLIPLTSSFCFVEPPFFNNAWILAKADEDVWKPVIDQLHEAEETIESKLSKLDLTNRNDEVAVLRTTGPVCFTKALRKVMKDEPKSKSKTLVKILDANLVEPYSVYFKLGDPKYFEQLAKAICENDKAIAISALPSTWTNVDKKRFLLVRKIVHLAYRHEVKREVKNHQDHVKEGSDEDAEEKRRSHFVDIFHRINLAPGPCFGHYDIPPEMPPSTLALEEQPSKSS